MVWQSPNTGLYYNEHGLCDKDGRQITIDLGKVLNRAPQFTRGQRSLRLSLSIMSEMDEFMKRAIELPDVGSFPEPPPLRKPLLSDTALGDIAPDPSYAYDCAAEVRAFYEDKITKGDLRVVETVKLIPDSVTGYPSCPNCGNGFRDVQQFCPGCGAKIVEG